MQYSEDPRKKMASGWIDEISELDLLFFMKTMTGRFKTDSQIMVENPMPKKETWREYYDRYNRNGRPGANLVPAPSSDHEDGFTMLARQGSREITSMILVHDSPVFLTDRAPYDPHPTNAKLVAILAKNVLSWPVSITLTARFIKDRRVDGDFIIITKALLVPPGETLVACGKDFETTVTEINGYYRTVPYKRFKEGTEPKIPIRIFVV